MKQKQMNIRRRNFLQSGSLTVASLALATRVGSALAQGKGAAPHLDEKDAQAAALGYKHDAKLVDKKKYTQYKTGEACANCQQFQGKAGAAWGPCTIFPGKEVSAKGWCSAYTKKA